MGYIKNIAALQDLPTNIRRNFSV